ncbi:MAG: flippase activity-associated protein Agl23 [Limisphaerales bacterium]
MTRRWILFGLLFAAIVAAALRGPKLGDRPMHNDEAVNGIKFGQLWDARVAKAYGPFKYDPNEHHGPALAYFTFALARLTGAPDLDHFSEARLRAVDALFGLGLILLLPLIADGLGRRPVLWAGVLTAVSPAMVFYSRYFIHEMLLVFFSFVALAAGWRYWRSRKLGWALLAGAGVGLMHSTKETFVITLAAAALALALNHVWNHWLDASGPPVKAPPLNLFHLAAALAVWLGIALVLFSSFFTNAEGPRDSIRTYGSWLGRAGGGSPHIYPWTFYFHRLLWFHAHKGPVWTEAMIGVLALIGAASGFTRQRLGHAHAGFIRFLALYTFSLTAAYCLISYKTPWCLLGFWHGMILLAAVGAAVLIRCLRGRVLRLAAKGVLLAGVAHLGWQAWRASFPFASDPRNPYVFAQTWPDLLRLVDKVKVLAQADPLGPQMLIKVIAPDDDYWPLPWYLRDFRHVAWSDALPKDPYAPVMIVAAGMHAALDETRTHLMAGYFELRPQVFLELYVQLDLWKAYLQKRPPTTTPAQE